MGKLVLVGMGLCGAKSMSLDGLQALKECSKVYMESYTNVLPDGVEEDLEKICSKKITVLPRCEVEGEKTILQAAKEESVALLVSGDPLIATTHVSLALSARKRGIKTEVFHAASIISAAISESGLQVYKFGKTCTLAYWRENYKPMAAYDTIRENLSRGLHTLVLLDIDEVLGPMKPEIAAKTLLDMEAEGKKGIFSHSTKIVLLQGLGWKEQSVKYTSLDKLLSISSPKKFPPASIVVPARLHFIEEEFLSTIES